MDVYSGGLLVTVLGIYIEAYVADQYCEGRPMLQTLQYERELSQSFLTLDAIGLQQCSTACLLRSKCQILSFELHTLTCKLGDNVSQSVLASSDAIGTISRSSLLQYQAYLVKSCAGHSCDVDYLCVELSSGQSTCVYSLVYVATAITTAMTVTSTTTTLTTTTTTSTTTSTTTTEATTTTASPTTTTTAIETATSPPTAPPTTTTQTADILCGNLPSISNAVAPTSSDRSVGTSLTYTCLSGHVLTGSPIITCEVSGQWSTPTLVCVPCDTSVFTYNQALNFCYKAEVSTRYKQAPAKTFCAGLGGRLAKIDTAEKLALLAPYLPSDRRAFVDGSDTASEGTWVYSDGTGMNMNLFQVGFPSVNTLVNCAAIHQTSVKLIDQDCLLNRYVFCDKDLS